MGKLHRAFEDCIFLSSRSEILPCLIQNTGQFFRMLSTVAYFKLYLCQSLMYFLSFRSGDVETD